MARPAASRTKEELMAELVEQTEAAVNRNESAAASLKRIMKKLRQLDKVIKAPAA